MTATGQQGGHDGQGNVLYPSVTGSYPQSGTCHGGKENASGNVLDVTGFDPKNETGHDEIEDENGNVHGVTGTGQKTGTCHVVPAREKVENEKSPDEHDSEDLTSSGRSTKNGHYGTGLEDDQIANGFPCPSGLLVHENGKTGRNGNGSDLQMILLVRLDPKEEGNGKNHPKRGRDAQQAIETAAPPTPSQNPKVPERGEGERPPRPRPPG